MHFGHYLKMASDLRNATILSTQNKRLLNMLACLQTTCTKSLTAYGTVDANKYKYAFLLCWICFFYYSRFIIIEMMTKYNDNYSFDGTSGTKLLFKFLVVYPNKKNSQKIKIR